MTGAAAVRASGGGPGWPSASANLRRARCRRIRTALREQPSAVASCRVSRPSQATRESSSRSRSGSPRNASAMAARSPWWSAARSDLGEVGAQPVAERQPPPFAAVVVGQDPPGHAVQPRPGRLAARHVVEPAPGRKEGLGQDVGGVVPVAGAAEHVPEDRVVAGRVDLLESPASLIGRSQEPPPLGTPRTGAFMAGSDTPDMSASRAPFHGRAAPPPPGGGTDAVRRPGSPSRVRPRGRRRWRPGGASGRSARPPR